MLSILENPWIPSKPTPRQAEFLILPQREALYGGAAGGGKSEALLMAALQYVEVPNYAALLLRRTYSDLALPGALMERARTWLQSTAAVWDRDSKTWRFPSGATLTFGYLETEQDRYRYQSSEFQFIGFDELTQFTESQYRYLFSRLRKLRNSSIPLRMRAGSNPGGVGHDWVKKRFIDQEVDHKFRVFVPARLADNPHLDQELYMESLLQLDPTTRDQLLYGDWLAAPQGDIFKKQWWKYYKMVDPPWNRPGEDQEPILQTIQSWDTGYKIKTMNDPSVCTTWHITNRGYYVADRWNKRVDFPALKKAFVDLCEQWHPVGILIEDKSSGISLIQELKTTRYPIIPIKVDKDKISRAHAVTPIIQSGLVYLPYEATWREEFQYNIEMFPNTSHDDDVDSLTQFLNWVRYQASSVMSVPVGIEKESRWTRQM